jgi:hypothetical protein
MLLAAIAGKKLPEASGAKGRMFCRSGGMAEAVPFSEQFRKPISEL